MEDIILEDLQRSGLDPTDLNVKVAGGSEFAATNLPTASQGYVIPYYDVEGNRIQFYRIKLFNNALKYKQPTGSSSHVYFPVNFKECLENAINANGSAPYVLLTEGEKKAAAACKAGIPCVALGGVDNWKNRTIILPEGTKMDQGLKDATRAKLPASATLKEDYTIATGLQDLVDLINTKGLTLLMVYDTDEPKGLKFEVQRAAATLAYELCYLGVSMSDVKLLTLPFGSGDPMKPDSKVGLDDYLVNVGPKALKDLIYTTLSNPHAFPRHPSPRAYINKCLEKGRLTRKEVQYTALSMLAELDARGRRLKSDAESTPYYFDELTKQLIPAQLLAKSGSPLHESPFGTFLYREFGITGSDSRVLSWLASQFTGEMPVLPVEPKRVMAPPPDDPHKIAIQISDSQFVIVSGDPHNPFEVCSNGSKGLLFEQGHVDELDGLELMSEIERQSKEPLKNWWYDIFKERVNLQDKSEENLMFASLLYYISPWLLRWKGTQLPVELTIGEAGSGKSSLYELRLSVLTGNPLLRNIPSDLKDWFASIVNTGGLHVIDNVHFTNKELRQRLSDEMCRIITEPRPHIEMRQLFTNAKNSQMPVNIIFAMTAIQQPFYNSDIIQRSAILELGAVGGAHEGDWVKARLREKGGRVGWLAHHLIVLHKFLKVAENKFSHEYRAEHRLANYEQVLMLMCEVFGFSSDWVKEKLSGSLKKQLADADWTLEGLKEYVYYHWQNHNGKGGTVDASNIADWAEAHEDFEKNTQMINSRSLGRYMTAHESTIRKVTGITLGQKKANRRLFIIPNKPENN